MVGSEIFLSYRDRLLNFVADPDLKALDKKYEPYLDLHQIEDVMDTCDIIQNPSNEIVTGKLIWKEGYDYPIEIKRISSLCITSILLINATVIRSYRFLQ